MTWWLLLISVIAVWVAWAIGCVLELEVDKLEGKRPRDAGFSPAPIFPLFPLAFFGIAMLLDLFVAPWGTRIVFWLHVVLGILFAMAIAREIYRIRAARRQPPQKPISN